MPHHKGICWLLLLASWGACESCSPHRYNDPLAVMLDRQISYVHRQRAAEQARNELGHAPARIETLKQIVWSLGYPTWQRCDAIDQLVDVDEANFLDSAGHHLIEIDDWPTLKHIFALAIEKEWIDLIPAVVRNYARVAHDIRDDQRPERSVLERLQPGECVEQIVFEVFENSHGRYSLTEQVAAWALLNRMVSRTQLTAQLTAAQSSNPLIVDLQAAVTDLHLLPRNREGIIWLVHLRDLSHRTFWSDVSDRIAGLHEEQRCGLALRHLPMLLHLNHQILSTSHTELAVQVGQAVHLADRYSRTVASDVAPRPNRSTHNLPWADLAVIQLVITMLQDRSLIESLFQQAEVDRQDTLSEQGGVLDVAHGQWRAHGYKPLLRRDDHKFYAPPDMILHLYTAIGHYHFHAQQHENAAYAGPGDGDLALADRLNFNFLVFTYIDADRLNADLYLPDATIIDLGTIHR